MGQTIGLYAPSQIIAAVLKRRDAQTLLTSFGLLSGGTATLFRRGEYREALQVEIVCTPAAAYCAVLQGVEVQHPGWLFMASVWTSRESNSTGTAFALWQCETETSSTCR